jgi:ComF family protein
VQLYRFLKQSLFDLTGVLYPRVCITCEKPLHDTEKLVCHQCLSNLSFTDFKLNAHNPVYKRLIPVIPVQSAASLLYFDKNGVVKELIHQLKYENRPEIGKLMAKWTGNYLDRESFQNRIDYIVPVPLHPKKQRKRGYNQLTQFGKNLGNYFGVPYVENILLRIENTDSQTKKSAEERRKNVSKAFKIRSPGDYQGKHFLIIDDVMTTGATIEACAETILAAIPDAKVSVYTMAVVL